MCRHADGEGDRKEEEEGKNKFHFTPQLLTLSFSFFLFIVLSSSANGATIYPAAQVSISEPLSTCPFLFLVGPTHPLGNSNYANPTTIPP